MSEYTFLRYRNIFRHSNIYTVLPPPINVFWCTFSLLTISCGLREIPSYQCPDEEERRDASDGSQLLQSYLEKTIKKPVGPTYFQTGICLNYFNPALFP